MAKASAPQSAQASNSSPVEEIAAAYLSRAAGDPELALRCAITDALADLMDAERRTRERSRLISLGYVRNRLHDV
ncbi:hypothetical protein [Methylobacterium nodulans]|uniref:Uncharacterized protein n=1 Tax=Methylobacterium nodulans (strain LMG 21967 / CNCM I-2342 / ORS 2060) TaxID=460265 RepID=B8IPN1_METNO|nr:hypothetical protein [Methylobacterium nodulans]ACL62323.1 conserved hypothetical protein [Methylobacterium nodulans ORS 2060]